MHDSLRWINSADIAEVARSAREPDRVEWALMDRGGTSCLENMLEEAVTRSNVSMAAVHNDNVIALFGVVLLSDVSRTGSVWALATEEVEQSTIYRRWYRISHQLIPVLGQSFDRLENVVHVKNTKALKFIRLLGFSVSSQPVIVKGEEFFPFHMDFCS
ncbi:hypothetical protein AB835_02095 [Candidatus Endobugula sertula]|uniref:N-acetyltransferase domain-containing protein n=1 Tax=Candidatus Endobugula sertula TaxID=62101 RepID=A0A1D2QSZ1_9GAMM|nr:hypothetical protein AB835_02095 [Candidatus Endobugula sertula]